MEIDRLHVIVVRFEWIRNSPNIAVAVGALG